MKRADLATYDQYGRIFQQFDAAGDALGTPYGTRFVYQNGHLRELKEAAYGSNGQTYIAYVEQDARGNIIEQDYSNGTTTVRIFDPATGRLNWISTNNGGQIIQDLEYDWDSLGNLNYRIDRSTLPDGSAKDFREDFAYDGLNRLRSVTLNAPGLGASNLVTQSLSYNAAGNIQCKRNNAICINSGDVQYTYGAGTAGPHAVTGISSGTAAGTYQYDANGNQFSGNNRTISYTAFERLHHASRGGNSSTFWYDAGLNWVKRTTEGPADDSETLYRIGNVEIILRASEPTEYRRMLGENVQVSHYDNDPTVAQTRYLHKDHLGSVDAITDHTGNVIETLSFGAYGARRSHENWSHGINISQISAARAITSKGFTGHEMVDNVGIIHMGGRIYDAEIGRFLQADPFVQAPDNSQNLNRYSYVLNNPLSYTDPSGFFFSGLLKGLAIVAAIVITVYTGGAAAGLWTFFGSSLVTTAGAVTALGVGIAAAGGFVAGYLATGNLTGAVIGAFTGFLSAGIAGSFANAGIGAAGIPGAAVANGLASGMLSKIQGGKFGHGFLSAAAPIAAGPGLAQIPDNFARGVASAALGGTVSEATGGKFANGAITGAFAYAVSSKLKSSLGDIGDPNPSLEFMGKNRLNEEWRDNIVVNRSDVGHTDIQITLDAASDGSLTSERVNTAISNIVAEWSGFYELYHSYTGEFWGSYEVTVDINIINEIPDADLIFSRLPNTSINKDVSGRGVLGGNQIWLLENYINPLTDAHEFGHNLGFGHWFNTSNYMMSYSRSRSVNPIEIDAISRGYSN